MLIPSHKAHILLLTATPGSGKTTAIQSVAQMLRGRRLGGFYTAEIRRGGQRQGFRLTGFGGFDTVIAHVEQPGPKRVGKYGVNVESVDAAVAHTLNPDSKTEVYLVDEIGKMECLSDRFVCAMRTLMNDGRLVVATISKKGGGFIDEVKRRDDVELWELNRSNRDKLPQRVIEWLGI